MGAETTIDGKLAHLQVRVRPPGPPEPHPARYDDDRGRQTRQHEPGRADGSHPNQDRQHHRQAGRDGKIDRTAGLSLGPKGVADAGEYYGVITASSERRPGRLRPSDDPASVHVPQVEAPFLAFVHSLDRIRTDQDFLNRFPTRSNFWATPQL